MRFYGHTLSGKLEIHAKNTVQFTQTISHLRKRKKQSQIKRLIIQLHIVILYFSQQTQHHTSETDVNWYNTRSVHYQHLFMVVHYLEN